MIAQAFLAAAVLFGLCGGCTEYEAGHQGDALWQAPSEGRIVVNRHPGGLVYAIWERLEDLRDRGISVEVRGGCYSACTMTISEYLPANCSTWNAAYHFHGAAIRHRDGTVEEVDDRLVIMWNVLPPEVRAALPPPEEWTSTVWNYLSARDLEAIQGADFRKCT